MAMRSSAHVRLFLIAIAVWAGFWVAGLPDYYQQYSFTTMAVGSAVLAAVTVFAGFKVIGGKRVERRKAIAFWLSLYFTAPFAVLDYLYCGLYLGHGFGFLSRYWYLTVYYVLPWLIFIPIGHHLSRAR
jgi:hypothetical protein